MRPLAILLISVALATSGCFGKDEEPPATTPTPTGGGTTTTPAPTGATPTSPTTGGTTPTPPVLQPRQLCAPTNDFSSMTPPVPPTGPAVRTADCGAVPAGYTKLTLEGNFTAGTPPIAGPGIVVKVLDAAGGVAASCNGPPAGPVAAGVVCTGNGPAAAGAYTMQFEGSGGVAFSGVVMISP